MIRRSTPPSGVPRLGLVCLSADRTVRYRTVTRTRLLSLSPKEQRSLLRQIYLDNLARLGDALTFCHQLGIPLYRMPSNLLPFADTALGAPLMEQLAWPLSTLGDRAAGLGIRLVLHPDQFVVLSSDSPETVENARLVLRQQARLLDLMGLPRSPFAAITLHGGKAGRAERLVRVVQALPDEVRLRVVLENDERAYRSAEILAVCEQAGVPMVFDAHHHIVREGLTSYDDEDVGRWLIKARFTWPDPGLQLVHISNGRGGFADPAHSDLIERMPRCFEAAPWIEVEAKAKEQAILHLRKIWPVAGAT